MKNLVFIFSAIFLFGCDNSNISVNKKYQNDILDSGTTECLSIEFELVKAKSDNSVYVLYNKTKYPIANWGWVDKCAKNKKIRALNLDELNSINSGSITYR